MNSISNQLLTTMDIYHKGNKMTTILTKYSGDFKETQLTNKTDISSAV